MFIVNSRNRIDGNDSNFKIEIKTKSDYDEVALISCSIPKSWYLINTNDYFTLEENGSTVNITLPEGNPTRRALSQILTTQLNALSPNNYTYSVSYSNVLTSCDTGKFVFTVSDNGLIQPSLTINTNLFEVLGFNINSVNTFYGNILNSTNVIKLTTEDTILLKSDMIAEDNNLIASITSFSEPFFSVLTYNPMIVWRPCITRNNQVYNFYITNEDNQVLETNGLNITITLLFRKSNNSNDIIKLIDSKLEDLTTLILNTINA